MQLGNVITFNIAAASRKIDWQNDYDVNPSRAHVSAGTAVTWTNKSNAEAHDRVEGRLLGDQRDRAGGIGNRDHHQAGHVRIHLQRASVVDRSANGGLEKFSIRRSRPASVLGPSFLVRPGSFVPGALASVDEGQEDQGRTRNQAPGAKDWRTTRIPKTL